MKKILKLILILPLLASCSNNVSSSGKKDKFNSSVKITNGLQIKLKMEPKEIKNLKDINAKFILKNISGKKINYHFSSSCQFGYTIIREQHIIFDSRKNTGCLAVLTTLKLKPGQKKTYSISLNEYDVDKDLVKGIYKLKAFLLERESPKITVSFKVL
jgi:uncharacterized protein YxeA